MKNLNQIIIPKSVMPIHYSKRSTFKVNVGEIYFVSFGNNKVKPCQVTEISMQGEKQRISIEIPGRAKYRKLAENDLKNFDNFCDEYYVYADEIGSNPKKNCNKSSNVIIIIAS